ncbi:MAG: NAD(P)-binding protein [Gammaproteobacteria bacterium]|nr:NAD(P)-binding protein [Gammaproteobacteria bacterium]
MAGRLEISRRDFLNGVALGVAAGGTLSPVEILADAAKSDYYPPALTGLRGAHPGSFEIAHALAWAGQRFPRPDAQTDKTYDLVIVGGGISGLAAAFLYRQRVNESARILVLDNHDDFGGHAKRNEFTVDGEHLIGYGGSMTIDGPSNYSAASKKLLIDIGIEVDKFYDYFDMEFFSSRDLGSGVYFSREAYGKDVLAESAFRGFFGQPDPAKIAGIMERYPVSEEAKRAYIRLIGTSRDVLDGKSLDEKVAIMRGMSYTRFLQRYFDMPKEVTDMLRDSIRGLWGVGWDALSALEGWRSDMPGVDEIDLGNFGYDDGHDEPYIHHFPDGNAGVARALVRKLLPEAVPGNTMEDLVTSRVDYETLDLPGSRTRIRLNSTAVNVAHTADQKLVDVTYVRHGKVERTRGKHCIYAGYSLMLPHLCAEVPEKQVEAIRYATKVPLAYINIALRNWQCFAELGVGRISIPQPILMHSFSMDFPVSMGSYRYTQNPDQPVVLHGSFVPTRPDCGMTAKEQHVAGRRDLYEMSYADLEAKALRQLEGSLKGGGFDVERDVAAITVNRWPHGYAYEYNDLSDDPGFGPDNGPHIAGRAQIGRISIANSDASAYAYVDGAIDAAERAVNEQKET